MSSSNYIEAMVLILKWYNSKQMSPSYYAPFKSGHVSIPLGDTWQMHGLPDNYDGVHSFEPCERIGALTAMVAMLQDQKTWSPYSPPEVRMNAVRNNMAKIHHLRRLKSEDKHKLFDAFLSDVEERVPDKYLRSLIVAKTFGGYNAGLMRRPTPDTLFGTVGTTLQRLGQGYDHIDTAQGGTSRPYQSEEGEAEAVELMLRAGIQADKIQKLKMVGRLGVASGAPDALSRAMKLEKILAEVADLMKCDLTYEGFLRGKLGQFDAMKKAGTAALRTQFGREQMRNDSWHAEQALSYVARTLSSAAHSWRRS